MEFAILALPFISIILLIFALGLHLFYQELLDTGLHNAVRQLQTGATQNSADGNSFITNYLCPAMGNMVTCSNLAVRVQKVSFANNQDYYGITTGQLPTVAGALSLSGFGSGDFCNASPSGFILITAIYTTPSIVGSLLPNVFSINYSGAQVDAIMSQVAAYTENYDTQTGSGTPAPAC